MPRDRFMSPRKGTRARALINLMLRPQGVSSLEALNLGLIKHPRSLGTLISRFEYDCGFDIRVIGQIPSITRGRRMSIYRIVGRHRWNGEYHSFLKMSELAAAA